ncbi:MAG TPA: CBS domain-containing protein [Acidimicrobiales bacterium]|nr:CBS domain-containing protein [Acidimicrobiales bacterium]
MSTSVVALDEQDTILQAARRMADEHVGALPVLGEGGRLRGLITDRDIVLKVVALGQDPAQTRAGDIAQGQVVAVRPDASLEEAVRLLRDKDVRRLPVLDDEQQLIGMISEADLARELPPEQAVELLQAIASGP